MLRCFGETEPVWNSQFGAAVMFTHVSAEEIASLGRRSRTDSKESAGYAPNIGDEERDLTAVAVSNVVRGTSEPAAYAINERCAVQADAVIPA